MPLPGLSVPAYCADTARSLPVSELTIDSLQSCLTIESSRIPLHTAS